MTYTVREIFRTIQGEGARLGTPAVFVRFSGCNLWSGREQDRATAACMFCDTDFIGGEKFGTAKQLVDRVEALGGGISWVVLTGGEPGLQVDEQLISTLTDRRYNIAIETNGTVALPDGLDWICVSPKTASLAQDHGDELKLVFPQLGLDPSLFANLGFRRLTLSPMDGPRLAENTAAAIEYCLEHPQWGVTIQAHKVWGIR